MPCPDRRLLVLAQRFVLPPMISTNLSFDAVGVPITMVTSVLEKDNFLHGCITYALKMCGALQFLLSIFRIYVSLGTADAVQQ
jgi:hypothetical protein